MKRVLLISFVFILAVYPKLNGQNIFPPVSAQLEKLFKELIDNNNSQRKLEINDSIKTLIDSYAGSDTVFNHRFNNLKYLGQITSPDSLVKIITWNLLLDNGSGKYFCYLINKTDRSSKGMVNILSATYSEGDIRTDTTYSSSNWYGALYYNLRPFIFNGKLCYIILGIDYGNPFITRKIIDVVDFMPDGHLQFGMNCFTDGKTIKPRVVFEYASSAVMSVRFEDNLTVVFDHLSPFSPEMKGNHQYYGPDFSFDSYNFEKGMWRLKSDIDIRNKD
jgi:hypothetical protein